MPRTTKCISISMSIAQYEEFAALALEDKRSLSNLASIAIAEYLERKRIRFDI
jgi:hypothetical protein